MAIVLHGKGMVCYCWLCTLLYFQILKRVGDKLTSEDAKNLEEIFSAACRPLEFLSTDLKQRTYFMDLPSFVRPVKYVYGEPKFETVIDDDGCPSQKAIYDSWRHIPMENTLQTVLSLPEVFEKLTTVPPEPNGVISEFSHGSVFQKQHPLLSDPNKMVAAIDLYYDDLETANPIGSKATVHKIGVFYFTIRNLPSYYNSSMTSIHLLAIAYTGDLKKYGIKSVLLKLAEDFRMLESTGFTVEVEGVKHTMYATLAAVNGDNLGKHTLFGFLESFKATFFCDKCMISQHELQHQFDSDLFQMREFMSYEEQVQVKLTAFN